MRNLVKLLTVVFVVVIAPFELQAQDPPIENPRLSPRVMKFGSKRTLPSVFQSAHRPRTATGTVDWKQWIDSSWGEGQPISDKLNIFDTFWNNVDRYYGGFPNLDVNWDSLRDYYRPIVAAGVSRGRFYGIMSKMANMLQEAHTWVSDVGINAFFQYPGTWYFWPTGKKPIFLQGGWGNSTAGMGVVPMPDSSLFVLRAQPGNPLGMQPGDLILGYDGMTWKEILHLFDSVEVPIAGYYGLVGSNPEAYEYSRLNAAPVNWYMFDTIDVVRYATGDTLHLSTQPLADAPVFWDSLYNMDALPIPGVPMPDPYQDRFTSWGIIQGTSVGYIYLHNWSLAESENFKQAVTELMHTTTGLIIDTRLNFGGYGTTANGGFSLLFNENPDTNFDIAHRSSTTDHLAFSHEAAAAHYAIGPLSPTPDIYDHPIAVLTGPYCTSAGDWNSFRLRFHPMVRFFGKRSNTAYVDGYYIGGNLFSPVWKQRIPRGSAYSHLNGEGFLIHKGFPVDEEIWHDREDAANGIDAVVKRAVQWIDSASYAHDLTIDKLSYFPGTDSVHLRGSVENPTSHPLTVRSYIRHDDTIIDSADLYDDGLHRDSAAGDGVWGTYLNTPDAEDFYTVDVATRDNITNESYTLRKISSFTTAGPIVVDSTSVKRVDSQIVQLRVWLRNDGSDSTVRSIQGYLRTVDPRVKNILLGNHANFGNLNPGQRSAAPAVFSVWVDPSVTFADLSFTLDVSCNSIVYWKQDFTAKLRTLFVAVENRWNMLSVPVIPVDYSRTALFPGTSSTAFHYDGSYHEAETLEPGFGYWLKYSDNQMIEIIGDPIGEDTIAVQTGWNIIGSISSTVAVSSIGSIPPGIRTTGFYQYSGNPDYTLVDSIKPGYGYWVKTNATGSLILDASAAIPATNRIRIELTTELPPPSPEGNPALAELPIPTEYRLEQNYPNPFNPSTTIRYALPEASYATLKIYDVLGQEIATLVNGVEEAGYKSVTFDAGKLSSGIYFYRLQSGYYVDTKKLLLLR